MVILAHLGMIAMNLKDPMDAQVVIMMMILMLLHNVVHVVADQLVVEMMLVRHMIMNH